MAPIHHAAHRGELGEVMKLIQGNPGMVDSIDDDSFEGTTVHHADKYGHVEVANYLLDQGANVNARDRYGCTPLFRACMGAHLRVVELLVSRALTPQSPPSMTAGHLSS